MKQFNVMPRRRRESGAALITALLVSIATALLLAASLAVAMTSNQLGWKQADAQSALQLADAGVNSELQYIALNVAAPTTSKSSQPTFVSGITALLNGVETQVLGRQGTVTGYHGGNYYVYSSNDAAGKTAWDGSTSPYYITSSASVNGVWQTVQVQCQASSVFNVAGMTASSGLTSTSSGCSTTSMTAAPNSQVTITGPAACNGTISKGNGCSFKSPCAINYNCGQNSSGRFDNTCVSSGGQLCSVTPPVCYPKTSDVCRKCFGCADTCSDATAFATCKANSCNTTGVYQYCNAGWSNDTTINTQNCCQLSGGCGYSLNSSCYKNANTKPGTYSSNGWWWGWWQNPTVAVQTIIFEPGDYYFDSMQLPYDPACDIVIDSQACASGGTPGQVRFWFYDANCQTDGKNADYCQCPIRNTCASGSSTPDPGQFRIYHCKDNCSCTFSRPDNITDWTGNYVQGDFNYYCGVYACTNPATTTSASNGCSTTTTPAGVTVGFSGCSQHSHGCCNLCGSMLCDKCTFSGCCNLNYTQSQCCTKDPCNGGTVLKWSCNGH